MVEVMHPLQKKKKNLQEKILEWGVEKAINVQDSVVRYKGRTVSYRGGLSSTFSIYSLPRWTEVKDLE